MYLNNPKRKKSWVRKFKTGNNFDTKTQHLEEEFYCTSAINLLQPVELGQISYGVARKQPKWAGRHDKVILLQSKTACRIIG